MSSQLDITFEGLAKAFLSEHLEVRHEWRHVRTPLGGDRTDLICGVGSRDEVFASLLGHQIALGLTAGKHEDFEDFGRGLSDAEVAREAFRRFVELLSQHGHLSEGR